MVIDPNVFYEEVKGLERLGLTLEGRLMLSDRAHVILPKHIESDINKNSKIGTTKKGIGPTYEDKISRNGIRVLDIIKNNNYNFKQEVIDNLKRFSKADIPRIINNNIKENKKVMFEGAQGTLLDVDLGTYPFVTSSNATAGGACTGAGVGPTLIDEVIGITKAYVTRVGEGPFPSEIKGELASHLQTVGHEFGSVTGRPRKVGWLDMPLMRYAVEVNGITKLAITKLDVLSGFDKIKVATDYNNDKYPCLDNLPKVIGDNSFTTFPGWKEDITNVKSFNDLPKNAKLFIKYISEELTLINFI
jgi:adenylosuccinate synthase